MWKQIRKRFEYTHRYGLQMYISESGVFLLLVNRSIDFRIWHFLHQSDRFFPSFFSLQPLTFSIGQTVFSSTRKVPFFGFRKRNSAFGFWLFCCEQERTLGLYEGAMHALEMLKVKKRSGNNSTFQLVWFYIYCYFQVPRQLNRRKKCFSIFKNLSNFRSTLKFPL